MRQSLLIPGLVLTMTSLIALSTAAEDKQPAPDLVEVTPLGGKTGEFCTLDRALLFEDPDGTRILYDAGRTVAGPGDPRLGDLDAVLVSHVHGDHIGDRHSKAVNAGTCASPDASIDAAPHSSSVLIAMQKSAKIITGSEMPSFFGAKLKAAGGDPADSVLVRFGAMAQVGGVQVTTVPAVHSNGVPTSLIGGDLGRSLAESGLTAYVGPPTGYILKFSNGLVAYLSGDTGITAEQEQVVRDFYGAGLAVMNIGDTYTTGPTEAAHVVNEMIQPSAVIPSHANEEATRDGKVLDGTRTQRFIQASKVPVHVPLSGRTLAFDQAGHCQAGC